MVLDTCTGWVRHAVRFRESGAYEFCLDSRLSKGAVSVVLLDGKKRVLLQLSQDVPVGEVELNRNARCCLRWDFKNATGSCELRWLPPEPTS